MDCRITSYKSESTGARRRKAGFTFLELMAATAITSFCLVSTASLMFFSNRSLVGLANYGELEQQSRHALDVMTREIRQAKSLVSITATEMTFIDGNNQNLNYTYDPATKILTCTQGSKTEILLRGCDFIKFTAYQRNTIEGSYAQYPVTTPSLCKLIQLHWICSRVISGTDINTESVQSAKVVLRTK